MKSNQNNKINYKEILQSTAERRKHTVVDVKQKSEQNISHPMKLTDKKEQKNLMDSESKMAHQKIDKDSQNYSSSIKQTLPPAGDKNTVQVPGSVLGIMLDYLLWPEGLDEKAQSAASFVKKPSQGSIPLIPTLFDSVKIQKLKNLLTAIVNGNPDKVKAMIEEDPFLLLETLEEKDEVTALSGQRSNNRTAYRTALAVEDTQIAAMIKNKFIEMGEEKEANRQYHGQFPKGWEAAEKKRWAPVFAQLETLTNIIRDAKPGDITSSGDPEHRLMAREGSAVATTLVQFRSQLDALLHEIVTTGRHFNSKLLLQAFKIYDDHYKDYFGNDWRNPRAMLFWQQVIGTIERGLPVNYVQAFCDGLHITEKKLRNNNPQGRSLKINLFDSERRAWVSSNFYPLSVSRLGFNYAIYTGGGGQGAQAGIVSRFFQNLCQSKAACIQKLIPHQNVKGHSPSCVVM